MRRAGRLSIVLGVVATLVMCVRLYQANVAGQRPPQPPSATSAPVFLRWPLPAAAKAYAAIDGQRLWYVQEQADIAERYRDQGTPSSGASSPARPVMSRPRSGC